LWGFSSREHLVDVIDLALDIFEEARDVRNVASVDDSVHGRADLEELCQAITKEEQALDLS
jgi:hypothetical protein